MGLFDFLKPKDDRRKKLLDLIISNADSIEMNEKKTRTDAEYLAICLIIDDLSQRDRGRAGYQTIIEILQTDYPQHLRDVITYVGWSTGKLHFKPEDESVLKARHQK